MGGSFDPVHYGHLRLGEEIKERCNLQTVEFIPTLIPPHKRGIRLTDAHHRVEMLNRAVADNDAFRVSTVEIERGGVSYLFDTLHEYRRHRPSASELFFIMGMDSFLEMSTWHRYAELFPLVNLVVATRPGYGRPALTEVLPREVAQRFAASPDHSEAIVHESGTRILFEHITPLQISATDIRRKIASGCSVRYLLPDSVWKYIETNNLYLTQSSGHHT